jgi:hypothetical protein
LVAWINRVEVPTTAFLPGGANLLLFFLDSGTTCRNDNVEIQCYDYNTYGTISVTSATWKKGCGWNFNTVNPSDQNVMSALSGHCTNYNRCSPTVNDGNIEKLTLNVLFITHLYNLS